MNKVIISVVIFVCSLFTFDAIGQQFTGDIKTEYTEATGNKSAVKWVTDGNKCVMHYSYDGNWIAAILDPATMQVTSYHNQDKENYYVQQAKADGFNEKLAAIAARNTGETKVINGHKCVKVIASYNYKKTEVWVATDVKFDFYKFGKFASDLIALVALNKLQLTGVPMESRTYDEVGNEISSWVTNSIDKRAVESSEMQPPASLKQYSQE